MFQKKNCTKDEANEFINCLVGQPFRYGLKSPDMDLYDLGFGADVEYTIMGGKLNQACKYAIHHTTAMEVFWNSGTRYYNWDTPYAEFHADVQKMIGLRVQRVKLSAKNDFWLDLGKCHMVIITPENGKESWRLFMPGDNSPHLVASDSWIELHSNV